MKLLILYGPIEPDLYFTSSAVLQEISVLFEMIKRALSSARTGEGDHGRDPQRQSDLIDAVIHHTGRLMSGPGRREHVCGQDAFGGA